MIASGPAEIARSEVWFNMTAKKLAIGIINRCRSLGQSCRNVLAAVRYGADWIISDGNMVRLCRNVLAALTTLVVRTNVRRWQKAAREKEPSWDERNRIIATFIPEASSVVDLGAGAQTLKRYLKSGCEYQPCDIVKSSPDMIVCDFNSGIYPSLSRRYDYVVCSGVFEYIRRPSEFLSRIRQYGKRVILSYNPAGQGVATFERLANGWVNHLTSQQLEALFSTNGLDWKLICRQDNSETIYELKSTDSCSGF
jgi:Methyltransferase domain